VDHPKTELNYANPFTLVVAVALSAQATDVSVNKATAKLFAVADTPAKMAALGVEGLEPYIKTIGLYRTKAKNVIALSRILLEQHGGQVPLDRAALQALPAWAQDRQRGAQRAGHRARHRGGHPCLPRGAQAEAGGGSTPTRSSRS